MKLEDEQIYPLEDVIATSQCQECGSKLKWTIEVMDGIHLYGSECCKILYTASPFVKIDIEPLYS